MLPQNKRDVFLWKEAQNVRRRHPERLRCPMDPYAELRNIQNYVYCGFQ